MPRLPHALLPFAALSLLVSLSACTGQAEEQQSGPGVSPPSLVPFSEYAAADLRLQRADPCPLLTKTAATALQASPDTSRWGPGEPIPQMTDSISHEWGCAFSTGTRSFAAWVAVASVNEKQAKDWLASKTEGCEPLQDAPEFGAPGAGQLCRASAQRTARFQGLYGDTWVGCEATETTSDLADLQKAASEWCGAVLQAAQATAS